MSGDDDEDDEIAVPAGAVPGENPVLIRDLIQVVEAVMSQLAEELVPGRVPITGYVFLWNAGGPGILAMAGTDGRFVAVFSTVARLGRFCADVGLASGEPQQINDGLEFVAWMRTIGLRVAIDPHKTETGAVGFSEWT